MRPIKMMQLIAWAEQVEQMMVQIKRGGRAMGRAVGVGMARRHYNLPQ